MLRHPLSKLVQHLRIAASKHNAAGVTDGELLDRFVRHKEESAFEALMCRHGSMVLGVCRRVTGNAHDAEDAFQATFLVLVRKASSVRPRDQVGHWLYGVAYRTALEAKRLAAKRRAKEAKVMPRSETPEDVWADLRPLLDKEINRLPDKHRAVLVLCDLEGKSRKEAAEQLRVPEGTVASRLARARAMLAKRLVRYGGAVTSGGLAVVLPQNGTAAVVPTCLLGSTMNAVAAVAAGEAAAEAISAKVAALTQGVMKAMLLSKIKTTMMVLILSAGCLLSVGVGAWARRAPAPAERVAPGHESYIFAPVNKDWIKRTAWLRPTWDPPESYEGVKKEDRKPDDKALMQEDRYFVHDDDKSPCKILMYYPSGAEYREIDNLTKGDKVREQFCRLCYPEGSPKEFMHWKDGKWMDGVSVSPDGRVTHRLKDGTGDLVRYGAKEGNRTHSWYFDGDEYLEMRYSQGDCVRIRLNDASGYFIAKPGEEELILASRGEIWTRRAGEEARYQRGDAPLIMDHGEREEEAFKMRVQYPQRRADFMKGYGKRLEKAGKTWKELKIEFLRVEGKWPE
jgi:RNA polymerase sigma factor (sigma-70 family)